jgi:hypothetical protein
VSIAPGPGEFWPHEISDATAYIEALPAAARVYVQEWTGNRWRFVFGDAKDGAVWGLYRVTPGTRFRVVPDELQEDRRSRESLESGCEHEGRVVGEQQNC